MHFHFLYLQIYIPMNIVVTGASGGIGFQTAIYLAGKEHNHIFAVSRSKDGLAELKNQFEKLEGRGRLTTVQGDVSKPDFLHDLVGVINKSVDSIQGIINNAGVLCYKSFEELSDEDWMTTYEVNVFAPVRLIRTLMPFLKAGDLMNGSHFRSHIVNIGSIGGVMGSVKFAGLSAYSSSKGALSVLSECLAEELSEFGVAVNCLALGSVETEMFKSAFPSFTASMKPDQMARYIGDFVENGFCYYNGKVLPVSFSTP